jgi:DNA adenine methylase
MHKEVNMRSTYKTPVKPLKIHGGKGGHGGDLAKWIISIMCPHRRYVEAFAGGLSVLLAKNPDDPRLRLADNGDDRGTAEVVNDLDHRISNFWRVIADPQLFERFRLAVNLTPFSRRVFDEARQHQFGTGDLVKDALAFFILARQGRQGIGESFASPSPGRNRGGMDERASAWLAAVRGLPEVHARLRSVVVEALPAVQLIEQEDGPGTLFYCDPPYLKSTRTAPDVYRCEMTEDDHQKLLEALLEVKGMVILSGYANPMYDEILTPATGWYWLSREVPNHASAKRVKELKTEVLWMNRPPRGMG